VEGWSSWETRTSTNFLQIGTVDSSPSAAGYFGLGANSAGDTAIQKQIVFMDQGKTVSAAGGQTLPAGPSGSLNGSGYVRLDGTTGMNGKSDLSYVDFNGIAAASVLDDSSFGASYRFYLQPYNAVHALQLNITVRGTDGSDYTFAYFVPGVVSGWNTASVTSDSGAFAVTKKGAGQIGSGSKTLQDWFNDPTFGSVIFGPTAEVVRVGFVVGINGNNAVEYLDWTQTSLLNGGDVIDFVGPSTQTGSGSVDVVPLPTSAGMGGVLLAVVAGGMVLRRRWVGCDE
jgi:hypothetical protein